MLILKIKGKFGYLLISSFIFLGLKPLVKTVISNPFLINSPTISIKSWCRVLSPPVNATVLQFKKLSCGISANNFALSIKFMFYLEFPNAP